MTVQAWASQSGPGQSAEVGVALERVSRLYLQSCLVAMSARASEATLTPMATDPSTTSLILKKKAKRLKQTNALRARVELVTGEKAAHRFEAAGPRIEFGERVSARDRPRDDRVQSTPLRR
jgi:hypothetical protein